MLCRVRVVFAFIFPLMLAACWGVNYDMPEAEKAELEDLRATGWTAKTLPELSDALASGELTSVELTELYLDRLGPVDPHLNAVLSINATALDEAIDSDARRAVGKTLGPLDGLPILLKDNIETKDPGLATTAGALALYENSTGRDSPLVAGLREQGAVILGKTNLSQWANFRSNNSISGWSALGGQVRNPHMLDRSPCGSSSGSGAAAAASLAAGTVGTETNGSIICPANVNGIVGFKPTVGLIPQDYIVPISSSQDTAGPMTKSVRGAAMMMDAMAVGPGPRGFVEGLEAVSLEGARIGVMRFAEGSSPHIKRVFDEALKQLEDNGAVLVEITDYSTGVDGFWGKALLVLQTEFKATLNAYLADLPVTSETPVRTLADLIAFNEANADAELSLFDQSLFDASEATKGLDDPEYLEALSAIQNATRDNGIDKLLADYDVDILVSPSGVISSRIDPINGDVWPDWAGAGWMAAIAGYPHASVPMGEVSGLPLGLSFIGTANEDVKVLSFAYAFEQISRARIEPQYHANTEAALGSELKTAKPSYK